MKEDENIELEKVEEQESVSTLAHYDFFRFMQLFFGQVEGDVAILHLEETRHATKVLRKKVGDLIDVINNSGTLFHCQIIEIFKDKIAAKVVSRQAEFGKLPYELHIAIAPTKSIDRFEWFLEKATEMGVSSVYPIVSANSERQVIKPERLQKVLLSATKQSLKGKVPVLHPLQKFKDFLTLDFKGEKYIAHCATGEKFNFFKDVNLSKPVLVCIGPEGDFNAQEIQDAFLAGLKPIALGNSRLRTETAGIAAVAALYTKA